MLNVLVVDDELPALEELVYLLRRHPQVAEVWAASSGTEALQRLDGETVDAVFLDIRMPGLSGLDLARVLSRFAEPPPVVFVSAYEEHAVDAFEVDAVDYLLKPVRPERLSEALRRAVERRTKDRPIAGAQPARPPDPSFPEETIPVELGGVTRFIPRNSVRYVEAHGDYARLHTAAGSHLVRTSLSTLEERWAAAGFVRIHRRLLVSLAHITQVRQETGRFFVQVGDIELTVSRRHTRELRELLVRQSRRAPMSGTPDRAPTPDQGATPARGELDR